MERHLTLETLARLLDESPDETEAAHLETCPRCLRELEGLREQTHALTSLPSVRPGSAPWEALESRLESEGLLAAPGTSGSGGKTSASRPMPWSRLAAGILLFLLGAGVGSAGLLGPSGGGSGWDPTGPDGIEALLASSGGFSLTEAQEVLGDKQLEQVRVQNNQTNEEQLLPAKGLFYAIGHTPNTSFLDAALESDDTGYLKTAAGTTHTNIPGVFACGDVQDKHYRQAVTAAGSGCMAALDAEKYLSEQE